MFKEVLIVYSKCIVYIHNFSKIRKLGNKILNYKELFIILLIVIAINFNKTIDILSHSFYKDNSLLQIISCFQLTHDVKHKNNYKEL